MFYEYFCFKIRRHLKGFLCFSFLIKKKHRKITNYEFFYKLNAMLVHFINVKLFTDAV